MRTPFVLIPVLLFFSAVSPAQSPIGTIVAKEIRHENNREEIAEFVKNATSLNKLLDLESHLTADNKDVRYLLYNILYEVGKSSQNEEVTDRAIYSLIDNGLTDPEPSNIGRCLELLMDFAPDRFSAPSKNRLSGIVLGSKTQVSGHIRLAGFVRLTDLVPSFEEKLKTSKNTQERWMLNIALARMGDTQKRDECLGKVAKLGINDQTIIYLLPDILFIEDRACIDFVLKAVSTDNFACAGSDPDKDVRVNCAFRLIELVAPYITDFPVTVLEGGDLDTNDYTLTLREVRAWIVENQDSYTPTFEQK